MVNAPTIEDVIRNVVMDSCIVQDDQRWSVVTLADEAVKEIDYPFAIDRAGMDLGVQLLRPKVQCAEYRARAVLGRSRGMRLTAWRPRILYRRRGAETGLVKIDQPDNPLTGRLTRKRQRVLPSDKFFLGALFLSEKRGRLNDRPRCNQSIEQRPQRTGKGRLTNGFNGLGDTSQTQRLATGDGVCGIQPLLGQTQRTTANVTAQLTDDTPLAPPLNPVVHHLRGNHQSHGNLIGRVALGHAQQSSCSTTNILMTTIQCQLLQRKSFRHIECQRAFRIGLGHQQSPSGSQIALLSSFQYSS